MFQEARMNDQLRKNTYDSTDERESPRPRNAEITLTLETVNSNGEWAVATVVNRPCAGSIILGERADQGRLR